MYQGRKGHRKTASAPKVEFIANSMFQTQPAADGCPSDVPASVARGVQRHVTDTPPGYKVGRAHSLPVGMSECFRGVGGWMQQAEDRVHDARGLVMCLVMSGYRSIFALVAGADEQGTPHSCRLSGGRGVFGRNANMCTGSARASSQLLQRMPSAPGLRARLETLLIPP